jgi:hypothetical protein
LGFNMESKKMGASPIREENKFVRAVLSIQQLQGLSPAAHEIAIE